MVAIDDDADQLERDNEELAAEVAMLKGILAETLSRRRLEAARMRVLNAGLVATKEYIQQDAMQVSAKAIRMGAADAAAAAIIAVAESEGTAKALDKLGETEQLAQMREMEAAMNGGGAGGGVVAAPPRIVDIDAVIEFEFGNAFKDPMWDEIVGDREHTIRGLRDLLVKLVAHHGDDEVISKFEATTVKKDKFIELYKTLPGEHDMVDGHAALVFSAFNPEDDSVDAELNYNAYLVCLALAAQGNEREKLQTMFQLFDTDGSGELAGSEIEVIARALGSITGVMGQIDETTVAKALMAFGAFSGGEVNEDQFIEKCLEDPALSKLVQRSFLVVLAKPPLAQGTMSKFTQQATVARRRAEELRAVKSAASDTIVEEDEDAVMETVSISSEAEAAEAAEIARMEAEVQAKRSNLERKKSIKTQQKEKEAAITAARKTAEAGRQKEVEAAQRKAALLKAEEDALRAKQQAAFQKKQDEDNAKMRAKQEAERQQRIAVAAAQQKKVDAEKAAAAAAAAAAAQRRGVEELAKQKLAGNIKAATKDNELDDYYAHQAAAPDVDVNSEAYRRAMIEKAEREAIAEMTGGSDMNNDDAILAAMAATQGTLKRGTKVGGGGGGGGGGGPLASLSNAGMSIIPDPITEEPAAAAGGARIVMPDADYLLSMIMTGIDEEAEQADGEGRRFHINNDGIPTFREQDVMQRPFGGPLQNTLSRRDKATTDVERRRAEAEARKKEAQARSLGRNASARSKETAF